jgi:diketogulonate reductase-like aldo/keto reductase
MASSVKKLVIEGKNAILQTGSSMPLVGLGTWKIAKDVTASVIVDAIRMGYRHLDCACDYGNEKEGKINIGTPL